MRVSSGSDEDVRQDGLDDAAAARWERKHM